jgi:ABC-type nitrate/sulfonate/bicarbonate transport system ATPase subunit
MNYKKEGTLLLAKNLTKRYGNKLVIRDVTIEIKDIVRPDITQGQVVSLIGRSGIGKSTVFRMLAALEKPTSGEVLISNDGKNLKPVREGDMGVVFQNYIMFEHLTVRQNFKVALAYRTDAKSINVNAWVDSYATEFNLGEHLDKYPCQLSGGQKQRAAIIVQLLNGSNFLLLDEPLSGLDMLMIDKITALLTKVALQNELQTIIIVSHDLENCLAISDTAFVLGTEDGQEGAVLKAEIDLIERGLAWQPGIKDMPTFRDTLKEVKALL